MTTGTSNFRAVKVCGIVSPSDAEMITRVSQQVLPQHFDLLMGMILWPGSKRSISTKTAKLIADIAHDAGATPVAVFVDESVDQMKDVCTSCGINVAQLHGPKCRLAWEQNASDPSMPWIDVRDVDSEGHVSQATNSPTKPPFWSIYDSKGGGTGKPFDWGRFSAPSQPWLLAGGLTPDNVFSAIKSLQPSGVDVAGGVAGPDRCAKDEDRLRQFLEEVVKATS